VRAGLVGRHGTWCVCVDRSGYSVDFLFFLGKGCNEHVVVIIMIYIIR